MDYRTLGQTDLRVSPICFGTWSFGGDWGDVRTADAEAAVRTALDLGINVFDTARADGAEGAASATGGPGSSSSRR
jgi:aryl-alcohol dehydrogenase-like predicted oxidoreductase